MAAASHDVAYIWHKDYLAESDKFLPTTSRNEMVHSLIESYGLLNYMKLIKPRPATVDEMSAFHSTDYLNHLKNAGDESTDDSENEDYGLEYDCPYQDGLFEYCQNMAGGTMDAARLLCNGACKYVIHWPGGWHHAKRSSAAGYCYVNDCVLGITLLRRKFQRVLYVDVDLHHGDGVQDAFCATDKVACLSFHKYESGFFPGSGSLNEIGIGKGKYYSINVPLLDGIRDDNFCMIADKVLPLVHKKFHPDAILCQLGADGLNGDPMCSFNLTEKSIVHCVKTILDWNVPTLFVGGGGYNSANVARCWTAVNGAILGVKLPENIPEHDFFTEYGPAFELPVSEGLKKDQNTSQYLSSVVENVSNNLDHISLPKF